VRYWTGIDGEERQIELLDSPEGLIARIGDREVRVDLRRVGGRSWYSLLVDGRSHDLVISENGSSGTLDVSVGPYRYSVEVEDARTRAAKQATGATTAVAGPERIAAVMPGIVRSVSVRPGDRIAKGEPLLILEAMKMQNEIRAPRDAVVESVHVEANTVVAKGAPLVTLAAPVG
jgi:biotin carboxyl carrier protein